MKKIIYSLLLATALSGCYEDKGNYDYTLDSMNEITSVKFSPAIVETAKGEVLEVQQALNEEDTHRRVDVILEQTLLENLDKLEFNWFRTYTDVDGKSVKDTIYSKGFLEFDLPVGKSMTYDIFLQIYDKTTTLSHYSQFKIMTRPIFKNSLFVLHGNEGERKLGNIEIIGGETKVRSDIMEYTPTNNYENATGLAYTTLWDESYGTSGESINRLTVFNKGAGTKVYDPFGMIVKFDEDMALRPKNSNFTFKKMITIGSTTDASGLYRIALSEEGNVYVGNEIYTLYKPGYSHEEEVTKNEHQSNYKITAATISAIRFIFWDAENNRFLYSAKRLTDRQAFPFYEKDANNVNLKSSTQMLDAKVDFSTLSKSPEGLKAVLGYINFHEDYENQNPYFIFMDESTGELFRYKFAVDNGKTTNGAGENSDAELIIEEVEKLNPFMPNCDLASVTYNSWFATNYLFYSDGKTIYRYNVLSGDNVPVYIAPDGYDITVMKFHVEDAASHSADEHGRILSIGLHNGLNGAVAEIKFNRAADIDKDFAPLFYDKDDNGNLFGKIKDLQFANETDIAKIKE